MIEFWESNKKFNIPKANYVFRRYDPRDLFSNRLNVLQLMYDVNKSVKPDVVFIPNSDDVHQSHKCVHEEAIRVFKNSTILGYELPWNSIKFNMDVFISLDESDVATVIGDVSVMFPLAMIKALEELSEDGLLE